ncbi:MAG: PH domain-containing protein [Actinobacteria bacterium]|jgi:membrane protein YdbS with pleckstrin-like domain|nr:PH domain-containing protein [Actinomycetota bacterium]
MAKQRSQSSAQTDTAPEYVVARLHPHARTLFLPSLGAIAVAVAYGLAFGVLPDEWMRYAALALAAVLLVFGWLLPVAVWRSHRMTVTTRRVIIQHGLLRRTRSEIPFTRVHDVTLRSNIIQTMFASGDVHLGTGAERDVVMRNVPRAALVQAAITELVDRSAGGTARQRRENAR